MSTFFYKFFGVRGSYPVPGPHTYRYGGNTTCATVWKEVDGQIVRVVLDAGTGAIYLGKEIIKNYFAKKEGMQKTILVSHLHHDHTQGFPFFGPNYFKTGDLHFVGMETLKKNVGNALKDLMQPPMFPIEMQDMKSKKKFHVVEDGQEFTILKNGLPDFEGTANHSDVVFRVSTMKAHGPAHPQQGAMYYRITDVETGKSFCSIWDLESKVGGDQRVITFCKGATVMAHDTQYTEEEYQDEKIVVQNYGHSTYGMALDNAYKAGVKVLATMHYNPLHSDDFLDDYQGVVQAMSAMIQPLDTDPLIVRFTVEGETYAID